MVRGCLVVVALLALTGCESTPPSATGPDSRVAVNGALTALSGQTAVAYDLAGGAVLNVTGKGLVQGVLSLRGQQVSALRADGDLYLRAPAEHWRAQGMAAARAAEYGTRWARSQLAFDPGWSFAPPIVAQALRAGLAGAARPSRITLADGLDVFDLAGLRITAVPPYRVVSFPPALLGPAVAQTLGDTTIGVRALQPDELGELRTAFDGAVDSLGQPFVAGPVVATAVSDNTLRCTATGSCTDTVQVSNKLLGDAPRASARLVLKSSVTSSRLGGQDCGQELVTPLNAATTMACSVRYTLPKLAGTAKVSAVPVVTAEPVATVDTEELKQSAATELGP
ncbi:hypothetical protein FNH06_30455 [Amycolatopsis acidiphila]|uniref:Lipoprotein n=2 Tax=Amycolatopsis acidiphila TaxID=715473 RepID=A0A558A0A7_9PSEU|nr:hypothetical protein FNH06_30455 [Amycolatopsis acidiphila]